MFRVLGVFALIASFIQQTCATSTISGVAQRGAIEVKYVAECVKSGAWLVSRSDIPE